MCILAPNHRRGVSVPFNLLYLVGHPIQYQAPLLRLIAGDTDIRLKVLFEHMETAESYFDPGFGKAVKWDVPLTDGYDHELVGGAANLETHLTGCDALWVHGWDSSVRRKALSLAGKASVPVFMRGENTLAAMPDGPGLRGAVKRWYLDGIFKKCSGFLYIGSDNRRYYEAHGIANERLHSMPYAVDNEFFRKECERAAPGRDALRRELGIDADAPVILFAGKLQRRKHPATLLKAYMNLDHAALGHPVLLFAGDGEERPRLEAQALHSHANMKILGFKNQTELPALYDLADLFVLSAEREPWGLAVNEAMNAGCVPIVSPECGCAADLIDETCGRTVSPGNAAALTSVIDDVLCDREELNAMARSAREKISNWGLLESLAGLKQAIAALPNRS